MKLEELHEGMEVEAKPTTSQLRFRTYTREEWLLGKVLGCRAGYVGTEDVFLRVELPALPGGHPVYVRPGQLRLPEKPKCASPSA